jgi:hypothetical protein
VANRLEDALENVKDEHTFRIFLNALAEDRRESATDPGSRWQWDKIEDFLEAAGNWSQDSERGLAQYQEKMRGHHLQRKDLRINL